MVQHFPAIVTLLALLLFFTTTMIVGHARNKHRVVAPATTGHPYFERAFRVQMNTLENLVLFLPALWLFSNYVSPLWASLLGVVWLIGRIWYGYSYLQSAEKRSAGYAIGLTAFSLLMLGAAIGIIRRMLLGL